MGAWADQNLDLDTVQGLAENLLSDRQRGSFDPGRVKDDTEEAAKGQLGDILLHSDYGDLSQYVDDAGGVTALFDAIAGTSVLAARLDRGFALAAIAVYADDNALTQGGTTDERSNGARERLKEWAQSFGELAPYELGYIKNSSKGFGGALISTDDRYAD